MQPDELKRYARHLVLKEIGGPGQRALNDSKIAIIGAGGLGGPAGLYLAAAGIGQITIVDDDEIDLSNLQRQIQFQTKDIKESKSENLAKRLNDLNPTITVKSYPVRVNDHNCEDFLRNCDVILDGTDNFETRFLINKTALKLGIPLVSGALGRFDGQVATFMSNRQGPCYQCLVPAKPPQAQTCSEVGIVGALAGIIGSAMALEAIKLQTQAGQNLAGKLFIFDGLTFESRLVSLPRDPACPACS